MNSSEVLVFHKELETRVGKRVRLKVNDNRSTMLSVRRERGSHWVSMHRIFLEAPPRVFDALVEYIRGNLQAVRNTIQAYIEEKLQCLDYRHRVDPRTLRVEGSVYNLQDIYDDLNKKYFDGKMDIRITWFGRNQRMSGSRLTFGLYDNPLKLVKIHRMLDSEICPKYFIEFVVYHEMLHHVCPSKTDAYGRNCHHTAEFRRREQEFHAYNEAERWLKRYQHIFFGPKRRRRYGRA